MPYPSFHFYDLWSFLFFDYYNAKMTISQYSFYKNLTFGHFYFIIKLFIGKKRENYGESSRK
jgi:hypothetical protein